MDSAAQHFSAIAGLLPTVGELELDDEDFKFLVREVHQRTGIVITERKRPMLCGRLSRRLRALGLDSFRAYCEMLTGPCGPQEMSAMVNAITTNLTSFFREPHHFEHLQQVALPEIQRRAQQTGLRRLRIWSAGCSSGEEPYSLAMTLLTAKSSLAAWDVRILATDLDTDMVQTASTGNYNLSDAPLFTADNRVRFTGPGEQPGSITMGESVRRLIIFKQLNLLDAWPMRGPFDIIFCRNVMIYFDEATKATLVDRFADILRPGGFLYIGHSEALFKVTTRFEPAGRTLYRKLS
jgi:chemotaxis protein methyltransferase CheR